MLLEATDPPSSEPFEIALADAVRQALATRPELEAALAAIENGDLRERIASNLEQPDLSFVGSISLTGQDDEIGDSYEQLDDFLSYLVGLSFELPVGNRAARAELRRARLVEREALLAYEETALGVVLEVKAALRELDTSFALMGATRALRIAQTENLRTLEAEEEVREERSPEFLALKFQRQERLAQAQLDELGALCDYNRALNAYSRAVGAP